MDLHGQHVVRRELGDLHGAFDRCAAAFVAPVDERADAEGSIVIQPELDIGIPAGVIAHVLDGEKVKYLIDRAVAEVDHLRYPIAPLYAEAKRRAAANGTKEADELLRLIPQPPGGRLLALDAETGQTLWKNDEDIFGTQLAVSDKYGVVLMCYQPAHQASLDSELGDRMAALRTQDGSRIWETPARYVARPILNDRTIYAEPGAWDLLTGEALPFTLQRSYGCGIPAGSRNLLIFRSATLGYIDLTRSPQTENYGGIRPGCWVNAIPAGG